MSMSQNPYAPPSAAPEPSYRARSGTDQPNIGEAVSEAWQAMLENWGVAIIGMILVSILSLLSTLTILGIFLISPVLFAGYHNLQLRILDDEGQLGDLFEVFNRYGSVLGPMLIYIIVCAVTQAPAYFLSVASVVLENEALNGLGSVIGTITYIFVVVRLTFVPFYVVDQDMGGFEAIRASWEATSDLKLNIVLLVIVSGIVAMLGALALCVGMLFTIPWASLILAAYYRQLEPLELEGNLPPGASATSGPAPAQVPW